MAILYRIIKHITNAAITIHILAPILPELSAFFDYWLNLILLRISDVLDAGSYEFQGKQPRARPNAYTIDFYNKHMIQYKEDNDHSSLAE